MADKGNGNDYDYDYDYEYHYDYDYNNNNIFILYSAKCTVLSASRLKGVTLHH